MALFCAPALVWGLTLSALFLKLSALYFTYFALLGVMAPYLSLYLEDEGYTLLEIGQLVSILMVTKMIAPIIWGGLADKYNKSVMLVRVGSCMTLLCYVGFFGRIRFGQ